MEYYLKSSPFSLLNSPQRCRLSSPSEPGLTKYLYLRMAKEHTAWRAIRVRLIRLTTPSSVDQNMEPSASGFDSREEKSPPAPQHSLINVYV